MVEFLAGRGRMSVVRALRYSMFVRNFGFVDVIEYTFTRLECGIICIIGVSSLLSLYSFWSMSGRNKVTTNATCSTNDAAVVACH